MISKAVAVGVGTVTAACAESVTRNMQQAIENRDAEPRNQGVAQAEPIGVSIALIYFCYFCHSLSHI